MITRREALRRVTSAAPGRRLGNRISEPATSNVVREVNRKRGTTDWILTSARVDPATRYRSPWIEGLLHRSIDRPRNDAYYRPKGRACIHSFTQ